VPGPFAEHVGKLARLRGVAPEQHDTPVEIVFLLSDPEIMSGLCF